MRELPPVSLIVLNWNGRSYLQACLSSLLNLDYPHFSVQVVDNASSDDSVAFVQQRFPQVSLQRNARNLGFAGGNNVALRRLDTPFAVLVNPDVVVSPDWLRHLIEPMLAEETIGIAGCKLYYPGRKLLQHAGGYLTAPRAIPGHYGIGERDEGQHDAMRNVDYVIGGAIALRRRMLQQVGLFDEGYFLYFEDVDLCVRAHRAAYRVVYVPAAAAIHVESAVSQKNSPTYLRRFHTGRWRFLLKHYALDDILQKTIPAEQRWLATLPFSEREAAALAYRTTLGRLFDIWEAREREGNKEEGAITAVTQYQVASGLQTLRRLARLRPLSPHLQQKAWGREQPFRSAIPLFGPLIARLRDAWNSVATKWYVRPVVAQQNRFNALVLQYLSDYQERLLAQDSDHDALRYSVAELSHQLARLDKQLTRVEERLSDLEQGSE